MPGETRVHFDVTLHEGSQFFYSLFPSRAPSRPPSRADWASSRGSFDASLAFAPSIPSKQVAAFAVIISAQPRSDVIRVSNLEMQKLGCRGNVSAPSGTRALLSEAGANKGPSIARPIIVDLFLLCSDLTCFLGVAER